MRENRRDELDDLLQEVRSYLDENDAPAAPEDDYSQWLYAQGQQTRSAPPVRKKRKKKRRFLKFLLLLLALFAVFCLAVWFFFSKQPAAQSQQARKPGASTILLAGTDAGGMRSDTMMLLHLDKNQGNMSLLSLPRDTYVSGYSVPKLNSALGSGGMDELMERVTELIGYRPDGYVLVNLDGFCRVVDAVGGIKFDVPQDMYYDDPVQDLHIDLKAGMQRLKGDDAMGLVRYRSGYPQADLRRVEVQRDFMKAAMNQIVSVKNLPRVPQLVSVVMANTESDLTMANFVWLAKAALVCDKENITMQTMPGYTRMINGGSYFLLDKAEAVSVLNACCNPYETDLTQEDLQ